MMYLNYEIDELQIYEDIMDISEKIDAEYQFYLKIIYIMRKVFPLNQIVAINALLMINVFLTKQYDLEYESTFISEEQKLLMIPLIY